MNAYIIVLIFFITRFCYIQTNRNHIELRVVINQKDCANLKYETLNDFKKNESTYPYYTYNITKKWILHMKLVIISKLC